MTGHDAWTIIAPILVAIMSRQQANTEASDVFVEAYTLTYVALKEFDERNNDKNEK